MRTDKELLIECVNQLKHIDEIYGFEPLATTTSLIREINQALNIPVVVGRSEQLPICSCENIERIDIGGGDWVIHCKDCGKNW